ncbi:M23 family metallopeptidase [Salinispira pacifica]
MARRRTALTDWWRSLSGRTKRRFGYLLTMLVVIDVMSYTGQQQAREIDAYRSTVHALENDLRAARDDNESIRNSYKAALQTIVQKVYQSDSFQTGGYEPGTKQNIDILYQAIVNGTTDFSRLLGDTQEFFNERAESYRKIPSIWPVKLDSTIRITSGFGYRVYPINGKIDFHRGIDIAGAWRTQIRATADGVVTDVWINHPLYGKMVKIRHANGFVTLYGHMSSTRVLEGQKVTQGQVIGMMGDTGQSLGRHLHYEVYKDGRLVNPIDYLTSNHHVLMSVGTGE